jgi:L-amino acid N-acyltransferase YncA
MPIVNQRLKIRPATEADAAAMAAIYAPFCTETAITFETVALSSAAMAERLAQLGEKYPWLVADDGGTVAGYVYAGPHHERAAYRWAVNVSLYMHENYRRQGVGRTLYTALFDVLKLQGFAHAIAGITLPNPPSVALHEALGFKLVGVYPQVGFKLGAWRDVGWWQLPLRSSLPVPAEPLSMAEARQLPEFADCLVGAPSRGAP